MTKSSSLTFHGYWTLDTLPQLLPASAIYCMYEGKTDTRTQTLTPGRLLFIGASRNPKEAIRRWVDTKTPKCQSYNQDTFLISIAAVPSEEIDDVHRALVSEHRPELNRSILSPSSSMVIFSAGCIHALQSSFFLPYHKQPLQLVELDSPHRGRATSSYVRG